MSRALALSLLLLVMGLDQRVPLWKIRRTAAVGAISGCQSGETCRYVDNACTFNGTGASDSCAASGGAAGRYNNLQSALTAATAGQTVLVHSTGTGGTGIYTTASGSGILDGTGFTVANSGTSGNAITLRDFGDGQVILKACADAGITSACDRATLSIATHNYIHFTSTGCTYPTGCGLRVHGVVVIQHATAGIEVDHVEMTGGASCDGNWSGMFTSANTGLWLHHNYFHAIALRSGCGGSGAGGLGVPSAHLKTFADSTDIVEYNTFEQSSTDGGIQFCIHDKQDNQNNHYRYNFCRLNDTIEGGWQGTVQGSSNPGDSVYHNVFIMNGTAGGSDVPCMGFTGGVAVGPTKLWQNTCLRFPDCIGDASNGGSSFDDVYGNVCDITSNNIQEFVTASWALRDYNVYKSGLGSPYRVTNASYASLAALRTGTSDDAHSFENALTSTFTSETAWSEDLHPTGALLNACKSGGTTGGTTIDCGAYSEGITCVGAFCG
jgi:hypothetical protein